MAEFQNKKGQELEKLVSNMTYPSQILLEALENATRAATRRGLKQWADTLLPTQRTIIEEITGEQLN